jgi:hypothetical protein
LHRITPAKLISSQNCDSEKYLEMLLDSAEAILAVFGFEKKKALHWWDEIYQQQDKDIDLAK